MFFSLCRKEEMIAFYFEFFRPLQWQSVITTELDNNTVNDMWYVDPTNQSRSHTHVLF